MAKTLTVSQVNQYIKGLISRDPVLNSVSVRGEISECKYHPSGHIYFTMKDEAGVLRCVMFASDRSGLDFELKVGAEVTVLGRIGIYDRQSSYQLYARKIERAGAGELYARFEALKKQLEEQGMFDEMYKRMIPQYARCIGVVTASSGAAIRDIMNIAKRRNPHVRLILTPVIVQGDDAPASIVAGIERIQQMPVDLIIVGRGGGSIEDLWAFNDQRVAQAIFDCKIPVISAVGHESDTTIADYVADLRAPTPSAAAELAVFDYSGFLETMQLKKDRMARALKEQIRKLNDDLATKQLRLSYLHPKTIIEERKLALSFKQNQLKNDMKTAMNDARAKLAVLSQRMDSLSPYEKIRQGYAFLSLADGTPVRDIGSVRKGTAVRAHVSDGWIDATVTNIGKETRDDR